MRVNQGSGWEDPDDSLETDFMERVAGSIGPEAVEVIQRLMRPQQDRLLDPPANVLQRCCQIANIDFMSQEQEKREVRKAAYRDKYGDQEGMPPGVYWATDAGIRIGLRPVESRKWGQRTFSHA